MSKITLYYLDLIELDAQRQRSEIRQFVAGAVLIAVIAVILYLARD